MTVSTKYHSGTAGSFTRLRRELPPGGSLENVLRRASFFSLHHRGEDGTKMGSIFAPRLYPSPPKCGRRFGFAENGDSRVSCFIAPKGAYDILRTNQSVTEGVRLIHPADCIGTQRILCGGSYHEEYRQSSNITDFFICVFHRRHSISASSKVSFRHRWLLHPTSSGGSLGTRFIFQAFLRRG